MKNYRIFNILRTFSYKEKNEFLVFLKSPFVKSARDYIDLAKIIIYECNDIEKKSADKIYNTAYPDKKYNYKTFNNRLNELADMAIQFIGLKYFLNDKDMMDYSMTAGLINRSLNKEITKIRNKKNAGKKMDYKSFTDILKQEVYCDFIFESGDFTEYFKSYDEYTEYFVLFFLEKYFFIIYQYLNQKHFEKTPGKNIAFDLMNFFNFEKLMPDLEENYKDDYLLLILQYYINKSYQNLNDDAPFEKFRAILFKKLDLLEDTLKNKFINFVISRLFLKVNSGKKEFLKDIFELYKLKLSLGLTAELKEYRYPFPAFRDFIITGLKLKEFDWVQNFINEYYKLLPMDVRKTERQIAEIRLSLYRKDYENALISINKIYRLNPMDSLDVSRFRLIIYYETFKMDMAFLEIDRQKHYLKTHSKKIPPIFFEYSKTFIKIYIRLLKLKENPQKNELALFESDITNLSPLIFKDWFLDKIEELK